MSIADTDKIIDIETIVFVLINAWINSSCSGNMF